MKYFSALVVFMVGCGTISAAHDDGGSGGMGATGGSGPGGVGGGTCQSGKTSCGDGCVDLTVATGDCGACGYACVHGRTCVGGRCTPAWQPIATVNGPGPLTADAAASVGGKFYVTGGAQSCSGSSAATFEYDPSTDTWQSRASMNAARSQHVATAGNGKIYVFGGISDCANGFSTYAGLEAYDPTANTWTAINDAGTPTLRYATAMIWTGSALFVFGGSGDGQFDPKAGALLDPTATAWTPFSCLLMQATDPGYCVRGNESLFFNDGTVYVWGGNNVIDNISDPGGLEYSVSASTWSPWTAPTGQGTQVNSQTHTADDGRRVYFIDSASAGCPATVQVGSFDRQAWQWLPPDTSPAPGNIGADAVIAWTGAELIAWSGVGACGTTAPVNAGARYQPPAP